MTFADTLSVGCIRLPDPRRRERRRLQHFSPWHLLQRKLPSFLMSAEAAEGQTPDAGGTPVPARRKHRPGLQRVQIACERCRARKNKVRFVGNQFFGSLMANRCSVIGNFLNAQPANLQEPSALSSTASHIDNIRAVTWRALKLRLVD